MATITGFTAERMLVIEKETVIDGEVVGNNLHLIQRGGVVIDAGNVRGPQGVPGTNGTNGAQGPPGTNGTNGLGVPAGGTLGQLLTKRSSTDNDTAWQVPISPPFPAVHFRATHSVQSIPRNTWTTITAWGAPNENIGGGGWAGGVYTIPATGRYLIVASLLFGIPNLTGWVAVQVQAVLSAAGMFPAMQDIRGWRDPQGFNASIGPVSGVRPLSGGDTVQVQGYNGHPTAAMSLFGGYVGLEIDRVE